MSNEINLQEAYKAQAKACGIEVGDTVKTTRDKDEHQMKAVTGATYPSFSAIDCLCVIDSIAPNGFFRLRRKDGEYLGQDLWPWYCLELVSKGKPEIKIGDYIVKFTDDGIKVGCQAVSKDEVKQIYRRMNNED